MKLRYLTILALLLVMAPEAHAGKPPKKVIQKILGQVDDLPAPKPRDIPDLPKLPGDPSPSAPAGPGRNPGLLDNLDELEAVPRPVPAPVKFKNVKEDPSILPVDIDDSTNITVKDPRVLKENPDKPGGVKDRQEIVIEPSRDKVRGAFDGKVETELPELPKEARPKFTLINHSYYNPLYPPNFKIEVNWGQADFVFGFDQSFPPGRPDFSGGNASFPPGTIIVPKDWYKKVINKEIPEFRISPDGKIQRRVGEDWVDYMNPHWPYR